MRSVCVCELNHISRTSFNLQALVFNSDFVQIIFFAFVWMFTPFILNVVYIRCEWEHVTILN